MENTSAVAGPVGKRPAVRIARIDDGVRVKLVCESCGAETYAPSTYLVEVNAAAQGHNCD